MYCQKLLNLKQFYRTASILALITIFYNIFEGVVSVWFGAEDETISLFGFGLDSFVEVISGVGIWHMIKRVSMGALENRDPFEKRALQITGGAFYLLAVGLIVTATVSILHQHKPDTTRWGIIVSVVSIVAMKALIHYKVKVGTALNSPAILADAACTLTCLQLSVILLISSVGFALTGIGYLDSIGSLLIAIFSIREGKEAMEKAQGLVCSCSGKCTS